MLQGRFFVMGKANVSNRKNRPFLRFETKMSCKNVQRARMRVARHSFRTIRSVVFAASGGCTCAARECASVGSSRVQMLLQHCHTLYILDIGHLDIYVFRKTRRKKNFNYKILSFHPHIEKQQKMKMSNVQMSKMSKLSFLKMLTFSAISLVV